MPRVSRNSAIAIVFAGLCIAGQLACQSLAKNIKDKAADPNAAKTDANAGPVPDEVSLQADRSQFDELRKDIPAETKRENDELAFIRGLMAEGTEEPSKVRDRFSKAIRDRRERFDRDMRKRRDDYTKVERKNREDFLKNAEREREGIRKRQMSGDERKRFFADQDAKRQDFFSQQNDKRKDFESKVTEDRKAFEDYARERTNEFNAEYRDYTAAFYDRKKGIDMKKRAEKKAKEIEKRDAASAPQSPIGGPAPSAGMITTPAAQSADDKVLEDFKNLPKLPATPLGAGDKNN